ncbi:MAG: UDP-N-acetylglucosamine 1-carboxyvinyltransferase [Acidobacteria bacterium]|nr:UDP-N-acetylglucosamine 1-carboxyvinyltransferase [Acidobacteriota bacterium]MBU4496316.1 UDP-N-acetylglucosamine 1-carboxyvinyltransferase [Acidobacteriota bacterium]MCG2816147.1 UDP-N-acetylglucosamine 1-carboxyvinyltransferase [Candidatus Aminicenantes bacterium]
MAQIRITGNPNLRLEGKVRISGAKNAVLPAIAASLLTREKLRLKNVPLVKDVYTILTLMKEMGAEYSIRRNSITLQSRDILHEEASYELVRAMRASILVLGPLLARRGKAIVALPGGCAIGSRPIDLHIHGLEKMGATISLQHGYIQAEAKKLRGTEIRFEKKTVGGTENLLMAAALAEGETVLKNCSLEPEVINLCDLLKKMGARIEGIGQETIRVMGVAELGGATHEIIPDRIEAGTFLVAGALTGGNIVLTKTQPKHLTSIIDKLRLSGADISLINSQTIRIRGSENIRPQDITTSPYPGFPTDMQAQFSVLMTQARGTSIITETIFDRRFSHINELLRLGANIDVSGDKAVVKGKTPLSGAEVLATDLRASASLVLAGLIASGETVINDAEHLERGYEGMEEKMQALGAIIELSH